MSAAPLLTVTGVILAGGQSRRMGQNKALMSLGGMRLIDRVVKVMSQVCTEILMVTNSPEVYTDLGIKMVGDVQYNKGSLGGIYSALCSVTTSHCLVVACDMPFLKVSVLRYLIAQIEAYDVVIPEIEGELQPMHAIYSHTCLEPIAQRLAANRLRVVGFFPEVNVRIASEAELRAFDPRLLTFQNLNTPEDMEAAARLLSF